MERLVGEPQHDQYDNHANGLHGPSPALWCAPARSKSAGSSNGRGPRSAPRRRDAPCSGSGRRSAKPPRGRFLPGLRRRSGGIWQLGYVARGQSVTDPVVGIRRGFVDHAAVPLVSLVAPPAQLRGPVRQAGCHPPPEPREGGRVQRPGVRRWGSQMRLSSRSNFPGSGTPSAALYVT
jgi:hypothetical protein